MAGLLGEHGKLRRLAEAQATFRRLATLVANGAPPGELFQAFAGELGDLLPGEVVALGCYGPGGEISPVATWRRTREPSSFDTGEVLAAARLHVLSAGLGGPEASTGAKSPSTARPTDASSAVAVPVEVEGQPWGAMAAWSSTGSLPADAQARLAEFAELMATVIANAESRAELAASRARIVAASDEARRRIERDLHDGAQQRLVAVALELRAAEAKVPPELVGLRSELSAVVEGMTGLLDDLRTIARGVHPAVLDTGGLGPALKALARRSAVPVELAVRTAERFPEQTEVTVYYVVSEALTNVAKHAKASAVWVEVAVADGALRVSVTDDGVGGARPEGGTGLVGLRDRVEALGGSLVLQSPAGEGTSLAAALPLPAPGVPTS
jgi:signal transduction histidine kinase